MGDWNSTQYLLFKNERTQPSVDLVNRIPLNNPGKILDVGCGPGNSTQVLAAKFPDSYVLGIDNSDNMISTAKKDYPNLDFKVLDASCALDQLDNDFDIVFSNACIQWVPNHPGLLKEMMGLLRENGILAVQTPMNDDEPISKIVAEITTSKKWQEYFQIPDSQIFYNLTPGEYFDVLSELSSDFKLWDTTYYHIMKSHYDILEWYRSTGLRPYLILLDDNKKIEFEQDILEQIVQRYPAQKNGQIIFKFPRFFFVARS